MEKTIQNENAIALAHDQKDALGVGRLKTRPIPTPMELLRVSQKLAQTPSPLKRCLQANPPLPTLTRLSFITLGDVTTPGSTTLWKPYRQDAKSQTAAQSQMFD